MKSAARRQHTVAQHTQVLCHGGGADLHKSTAPPSAPPSATEGGATGTRAEPAPRYVPAGIQLMLLSSRSARPFGARRRAARRRTTPPNGHARESGTAASRACMWTLLRVPPPHPAGAPFASVAWATVPCAASSAPRSRARGRGCRKLACGAHARARVGARVTWVRRWTAQRRVA